MTSVPDRLWQALEMEHVQHEGDNVIKSRRVYLFNEDCLDVIIFMFPSLIREGCPMIRLLGETNCYYNELNLSVFIRDDSKGYIREENIHRFYNVCREVNREMVPGRPDEAMARLWARANEENLLQHYRPPSPAEEDRIVFTILNSPVW